MDTLAHAVWTFILYDNHKLKWWAVLVGILPDLFAFIPHIFIEHFLGRRIMFDGLYAISHSFISILIVALILFFTSKKYLILLLAWALHIVIDIFTHPFAYYPTPYIYPFNSPFIFAIDYRGVFFNVINYGLIAILFGFLLYKEILIKRRKLKKLKK